METWSRPLVMRLLCGALLLLVDSGVYARMLTWGEERTMEEVVHVRRHLQSAPYCVAAANADKTKLQDALDWACGPTPNGGGVDCSGILQTGSCYSPNTLLNHASYAFNLYYTQQKGASGSCDFNGLATTTFTDPSSGSCIYTSLSGSSTTSPSSSNSSSSSFSPTSGSNTTFGTPTTGSTSNAMSLFTLSWVHTWYALMVLVLVASRL